MGRPRREPRGKRPLQFRSAGAERKGYALSKGTIQFPADKPLPYRLVTKMVKARVAEIEKAG